MSIDKIILNQIPPFISTCTASTGTGVEYAWFQIYANLLGLTSYTQECVSLKPDEFTAYVNTQTNAIGFGGIFYDDNYYLNYKTIGPIVQSTLDFSVKASGSLSTEPWSNLYTYAYMIVISFILLGCGFLFWYTEYYTQRYQTGMTNLTNKQTFHQIVQAIYRTI